MSGDNSITIYHVRGDLRIKKVIEDRGLVFRYDPIKKRAVIVERFSFKSRLNSSSDLWVPEEKFIGAYRQATAIFRSRFNKKSSVATPRTPQQLTFTFA